MNAIAKTKQNLKQLCEQVNQLDAINGGNGRKVRLEDFSESINDLSSIIAAHTLTLSTIAEPVTTTVTRIPRTWSNQHPKSLNDLDLSFFNLSGQGTGPSWCDTSWKNDTCPSFTIANGKEAALNLFLDYEDISDREDDVEDRFYLRSFPRIDDGSTDDYEIDQANGDEPVLYSGSDFELLIQTIKANTITG